ncbi:hypothetical protein BJY01DRAFT_223928 [Aspergillus pseudoustus]|uniref:Uncharacterized protein n=1 Tax=Aspergillus pseudoustus TaxID=1810923 RepID=A0ABR4J4J5_9EURO
MQRITLMKGEAEGVNNNGLRRFDFPGIEPGKQCYFGGDARGSTIAGVHVPEITVYEEKHDSVSPPSSCKLTSDQQGKLLWNKAWSNRSESGLKVASRGHSMSDRGISDSTPVETFPKRIARLLLHKFGHRPRDLVRKRSASLRRHGGQRGARCETERKCGDGAEKFICGVQGEVLSETVSATVVFGVSIYPSLSKHS